MRDAPLTVGTLNMGISARTGDVLTSVIARDIPCTFPSRESNSKAHGEPYSTHT